MKLSPELKRWLVSSSVTFFSSFLSTFGLLMFAMRDNLADAGSTEVFWSAMFSVFTTAVRAGVKSLAEKYTEKR